MNIVVLHPTGNKNVRAVLTGLSKAGMLSEFNTTLAVSPKSTWLRYLPGNIRQELLRRTYPSIDKSLIISHPLRELSRLLFTKLGWHRLVKPESGWLSIDAVYQSLDREVSKRLSYKGKTSVDGIYGYEDGALECFTAAKKLGIKCIYELPIAFWETGRDLMQGEALRKPEWEVTLGGGTRDSIAKLERKTKELQLADVVIVASSFVKDSLPEWAKSKTIIMSPFGSPASAESADHTGLRSSGSSNRKLRILFAGSMGQRKGLCDLFEAVDLLKRDDLELVVMGSLLAPMDFYRSKLANFTYEPGRSNEQVLELMRSCDVFCLPSIVEGRALVMQEAMSQGLPIIITPNTGGSDLVIEGKTGFLIPIRSPEKIAERIEWFLNNREKIPEMGMHAQTHAATYTWENYSLNVVEGIRNI
ncbi:MAG: glycosyltransferase family 4 protein [Pedobacter sp.]